MPGVRTGVKPTARSVHTENKNSEATWKLKHGPSEQIEKEKGTKGVGNQVVSWLAPGEGKQFKEQKRNQNYRGNTNQISLTSKGS